MQFHLFNTVCTIGKIRPHQAEICTRISPRWSLDTGGGGERVRAAGKDLDGWDVKLSEKTHGHWMWWRLEVNGAEEGCINLTLRWQLTAAESGAVFKSLTATRWFAHRGHGETWTFWTVHCVCMHRWFTGLVGHLSREELSLLILLWLHLCFLCCSY